jgi:hypothetical protein
VLIATALLSLATFTFAQGVAGDSSMRRGGGLYDPATEATVAGTIESVQSLPSTGGRGGVHLMLRAEGGVLQVDLGPSAFIKGKGFEFATGDQVTVIGSKLHRDGGDAIIARQVTRGTQVLTLRSAQGIPLWSRRGGRQS